MIRLLAPLLVAGSTLLAGCASTIPVPTTVETPGMPNPETALQQSMRRVDAEMAELGRLGPGTVSSDPVVPADLQRTVSFSWNGSLDDGVAKVAQSIGYTFYTTRASDAQPITVTVNVASVSVLRVFQVLGEQAGTRATVQVDPLHHQVQVIHHV